MEPSDPVPSSGGDQPPTDPKPGLNFVLMSKQLSDIKTLLKPRRYQEKLFREALERNVIIYLGTGLGKTFITVLYLNDPSVFYQIRKCGKKAVFLAPTQDLIKQQAIYINEQVPYRVKIFCGHTAQVGLHIDNWDKSHWAKEMKEVELMFMTPQIFCAAISHNLLEWTRFCVIMFDECHHACRSKSKSGHPYAQTLSHFSMYYHRDSGRAHLEKPRFIGLTASLINSMPKNREDIKAKVKNMLADFQADCITDISAEDMKPQMIMHTFLQRPVTSESDVLIKAFETVIVALERILKQNTIEKLLHRKESELNAEERRMLSFQNRLKMAASGISIKPSSFAKVFEGLKCIQQRLGPWANMIICDKLIEALNVHSKSSMVSQEIKPVYQDLSAIMNCFREHLAIFLNLHHDLWIKFSRSKPKALLDMLEKEYNKWKDGSNNKTSFSCIIFVQSRLEVVALNRWLQHASQQCPRYDFIKADYAIGLAATFASKYACITKRKPSEQLQMLEKFRKQELNVIVTTSVLEEGIDLPTCSTVIRYDPPKDFRQYVQSRGRARQEISSFVMMSPHHETEKLRSTLDNFNDFELTVKELLTPDSPSSLEQNGLGRISGSTIGEANSKHHSNWSELHKDDCFVTADNTVKVSSSEAKIILNMYCQRLTKGSPFSGQIQHSRETIAGNPESYVTILYLPSGCPLKDPIKGNPKLIKEKADESAVVAAIKALYEAGELDQNAIPKKWSESNIDELLVAQKLATNFETLDPKLDGIKFDDDDKYRYFESKLFNLNESLIQMPANKTYKLIRIKFSMMPDPQVSRAETREYFAKSTFGMIMDSKMDEAELPSLLFDHYGQMKVEYQVINDKFLISHSPMHIAYRDYTFKFLTSLLRVGYIDKHKFNQNCLVYIVPLVDANNEPDLASMANLTTNNRSAKREDMLVKLGLMYQNQRGSKNWMVVKRIHKNMNMRSLMPGTRWTFLQNAERNSWRVGDPNQPIVEVMNVAASVANSEDLSMKRSKLQDYTSRTFYYPMDYLDWFEIKPSFLFQARGLPAIMYRVYLVASSRDLEHKFIQDTERYRQVPLEPLEVAITTDCQQQAMDTQQRETFEKLLEDLKSGPQQDDDDPMLGDPDEPMDDEDNHPEVQAEGEDIDAELLSDDEDDDRDDDEYNSSDQSDAELDGEMPYMGKKDEDLYRQMISVANLNLNRDAPDDGRIKGWDMSKYKEKDVRKLNFEVSSYENESEFSFMLDKDYNEIMAPLTGISQNLVDGLVEKLANLQCKLVGDEWDLDNDELKKRPVAELDMNLEKPIASFQSIQQSFTSFESNLLQALTLRAAATSYGNLEVLENIGDSYLKYITSVVLFNVLEGNEGFLTGARSRLVCNDNFTYLGKKRGFGSYAIKSTFTMDNLSKVLGSKEQDERALMIKMRPKEIADIFEAFVGHYLIKGGQFEAIMAIRWLGLKIVDEELRGTSGQPIFKTLAPNCVCFEKPKTGLLLNLEGDDQNTKSLATQYEYSKLKLQPFEQQCKYEFKDKSLLVQAFTHSSYVFKCTRSYERLEFLGDAVLDFLTTMTLVKTGKFSDPGQLSASRSALVNNSAFAKLSIKYMYDHYLNFFNHELHDNLARLRMAIREDPQMNFFEIIDYDDIVKLMGDLFESVAGAIYLDSGCSLDAVWRVYHPMMHANIEAEIANPSKNPLARLHEIFSGSNRIKFEPFDVKKADGILCGMKLTLLGYRAFEGHGMSKTQAKKRAVQAALNNLPGPELQRKLDEDYKQTYRAINKDNNTRGDRPRRGGHQGGGGRGRTNTKNSFRRPRSGSNSSSSANRGRPGYNQRQPNQSSSQRFNFNNNPNKNSNSDNWRSR